MSEENKQSSSEQVTEATETPDVSNETKKTETKKIENKSNGLRTIALVVLVLVALFTLFKMGVFGGDTDGDGNMGLVDSDKVVATVIGTTITRADLDEKIEQVRLSLPAGAADPTEDAAFELQLLEDLIDLELLTAAAMEKNYTVTDDEVEAEIALIIEQFPSEEEFYSQLETVGITEDELKENIETEMHIRRLLEEDTDLEGVTVSEEEIETLYKASVGDSEDVPPLSEVSEIIRAQITNQKSAEIIDAYVTELRADADIEITL